MKHLYISNFRFHLLFTNRTCLLNMRNLHMEELALYNLCTETRPLSPFFPPRSSRHPSLYPHLATPAGCDASPGHSWPPEIATGSPGPPLFPPQQPFVHDAALRHFKQFVSHDAAESRWVVCAGSRVVTERWFLLPGYALRTRVNRQLIQSSASELKWLWNRLCFYLQNNVWRFV